MDKASCLTNNGTGYKSADSVTQHKIKIMHSLSAALSEIGWLNQMGIGIAVV